MKQYIYDHNGNPLTLGSKVFMLNRVYSKHNWHFTGTIVGIKGSLDARGELSIARVLVETQELSDEYGEYKVRSWFDARNVVDVEMM